MQNHQSSLDKNFLFDFDSQARTEINAQTTEVNLFEDFNNNQDYVNQSYGELNGKNKSLDNLDLQLNIKPSEPDVNINFDNDVCKNRNKYLNVDINYVDDETEDNFSQVEDSEIHYLNLIKKSEIAVYQQNALLNNNYRDYNQQDNFKTYTIVCIDDSRAVVNAIKTYLDDKIFSVVGINDSLKALMQIVRLKPDLILLDISMPTLDGYELCSLLRKHSSLKNTPIIMVTGRKGIIDRVKAKIVKASDYLTKPFQKKDLLKVIFKYIV